MRLSANQIIAQLESRRNAARDLEVWPLEEENDLPKTYVVLSDKARLVKIYNETARCECPDAATGKWPFCKHVAAVDLFQERQKFKVGDKVRIVKHPNPAFVGLTGEIVGAAQERLDLYPFQVLFSVELNDSLRHWFSTEELCLV